MADPIVTTRREAAAAGLYKTEYGAFANLQSSRCRTCWPGVPHMPWVDPSAWKKAKRESSERQGDLGG